MTRVSILYKSLLSLYLSVQFPSNRQIAAREWTFEIRCIFGQPSFRGIDGKFVRISFEAGASDGAKCSEDYRALESTVVNGNNHRPIHSLLQALHKINVMI